MFSNNDDLTKVCVMFGTKVITILEIVVWSMLAGCAASLGTIKSLDFNVGITPNEIRDVLVEFASAFCVTAVAAVRMLVQPKPYSQELPK